MNLSAADVEGRNFIQAGPFALNRDLCKAQAEIVAEAAIFTEGDRAKWSDVIALGHLPVFIEGE